MSNIKFFFYVKLLSALVNNLSPDIRKLIIESIDKLDAKAQSTKNKFDDILVDFLRVIFN